ncbi:MAG TPA: TolC family protein [Kofleriaceae bacterium]|jgi:outer membrane protein TolC|nr:TolC family protein [Kofleriaceae bacterium]
MRSVAIFVLVLSSLALHVPAALAAPPKLTLEQVIAKALAGPKAQMAASDRDAAEARVDEADAARLPRGKVTAFATISPEIHCDNADCTQTDPKNFAFRFSGLFGSAQLDITQPLYTFGKIAHARGAARAGLDAQRALADEAAGDLAVDAAKAYWGVKTARELGGMLDDGIDEIAKALTEIEERAGGKGKPDVSIQDRQRVAVLLAEAKVQRADALQAEAEALAGLRAVTGLAEVELDDTELMAVDHAIPGRAPSEHRPQAMAARTGALAADELAAMATSQFFPDIALVASGVIASAQGADDPPSAFANDPYNRSGAGLVVGLQWQIEPWTTAARAARARADAHKAHALSELAALGARYDADNALADAIAAHDKVGAASEGEKAARTWLASVLQAEAIGTAESKDLADAYIAWFQMRARWAQAVFQWNVAVVRLDRAAGEFHAGGRRP